MPWLIVVVALEAGGSRAVEDQNKHVAILYLYSASPKVGYRKQPDSQGATTGKINVLYLPVTSVTVYVGSRQSKKINKSGKTLHQMLDSQ